MAVKIVRQPKKIALIGAPSSAAAFEPGLEKAPGALRAAGLIEKLQGAGYEVTDYGDCAPRFFAQDDEHPRARNAAQVVAGLNELRLHVEQAIKSGALLLVLGGECVQAMGVVAGARRYYKHINLLWLDRDADLNTPATTPSGRLDGMVVAHFTGRGAAELVRFWGEPPLVREPDITLFGLERLDPPEQEFLNKSPIRRVFAVDAQHIGVERAAKDALEHLHAREFVLHFDTDVIAAEDFGANALPGPGGLRLNDVREALRVFAASKNLLAMDVAEFHPEKDPDGSKAKLLVDLIAEVLATRLEILTAPAAPEPEPAAQTPEPSSNSTTA